METTIDVVRAELDSFTPMLMRLYYQPNDMAVLNYGVIVNYRNTKIVYETASDGRRCVLFYRNPRPSSYTPDVYKYVYRVHEDAEGYEAALAWALAYEMQGAQ